MSLRTRRILFILFIIAFLIITPLVISYAKGYKLVFGKKLFQKTGMLILDSNPEGAKIYLNNKPQQLFFKKIFKNEESYIKTPAKIKNLLPGEYRVKLELEGFWGWEKKLTIEPGLSTFAEDINLFKKNIPLLLVSGKINQASVSLNEKYLSLFKDDKIDIINLNTETRIDSLEKKYDHKNPSRNILVWSPDNKKIIAGNLLFEINSKKQPVNLSKILKIDANNVGWSEGRNDEIIYSHEKKDLPVGERTSITTFNISTKKFKELARGAKIADFFAKNGYLYFVNSTEETTSLVINEIHSLKTVRNIDLPPFLNYKLINHNHPLINLYDDKRQILYLVDPLSYFPLKEIINNVKYARWVNNKKLLYANDFEIWLSNFNAAWAGKKELLTRISEPITNVLWHPSDNYVIYSTDNAIYTIELDNREKHNIIKLIELNNISLLHINKDGDTLYFYAEIGNQRGLYKLIIQ
jgi:hypothetical protein